MRRRSLLTSIVILSITSLILTRHHLHELAKVFTTYATFYPYVARHPEILHRYPSSNSSAVLERNSSQFLPAIIHQVFLTDGHEASLMKYEESIESCRRLHSGWTHKMWLDRDASTLIQQHYPQLWPNYRGYKQSIQRANILRYAVLDRFGGVYLDLDVTCLQSLDELKSLPWLTPGAYPAGVNNAFVLSRPRHPFLAHLLAGVPGSDLWWGLPYVENMLSTGCMFFSNQWMSYVRSMSSGQKTGTEEDRVYILADADGEMSPHMLRGAVTTPLFRHGGASSWHGRDAAAIVLIGEHYLYVLSMIMVVVLFAVWKIWGLSRRRRERSWMWGRADVEKTH